MHAFDRQTDRQTDRNLVVRPRCIPCSAVKKSNVMARVSSGKITVTTMAEQQISQSNMNIAFTLDRESDAGDCHAGVVDRSTRHEPQTSDLGLALTIPAHQWHWLQACWPQ